MALSTRQIMVTRTLRKAALTALLTLACSDSALAGYIGESFMQVPGIAGGWPGKSYHDWLKFESREWVETPTCAARQTNPNAWICDEQLWKPLASRLIFSPPWAPPTGKGKLAVALDKRSPAFKQVMARCQRGEVIPEITYAESSEMARRVGEVGMRPANVPEFFEYKLINVTLSCPVVANAPEQALILSFSDIQWLNFRNDGPVQVIATPAKLPPLPATGESRTFLLTWIQPSGNYHPDECPQLTKEPTAEEYFALWPKETVAQGKADLDKRGGFATLGMGLALRGPEHLNVCALPGIVPDPGNAAPQSNVARGFNLDGYDGQGELPANVHKHKNFTDADGHTGIDYQVYMVEGCVPGFRPGGNIPKVSNEMMRNGSITILLHISGIDNLQNDNNVSVRVLYSKDLMEKRADGSGTLPNYTFRVTDNPEFSQFFTHFPARIENGVIVTDAIDSMTFQDGGQTAFKMYDAQMRIEFLPDNNMKAIIGGYQDWRRRLTNWNRSRILEPTMRFHCPGLYNAYKREADGLKDPITGEYNGVSITYDIEGIRAFIPKSQLETLFAAEGAE